MRHQDSETFLLPEGFKPGLRMRGKRETRPVHKKRLLTAGELEKLENLVREVFLYITTLRQQDSLAECIQYPKIPPDLSESAIVHLRTQLFPESSGSHLGGKKGDVVVEYPSGKTKSVEVKATGESEFQRLSGRDVSADCLVWISFGPYFRKEGGEIAIYVLEQPRRFFNGAQFMWLRKFLSTIPRGELRTLTGPSLVEILRGHLKG